MLDMNQMAAEISKRITGAKITGVNPAFGPVPGFTITLENDKEQRTFISITANLTVSNDPGVTMVRPSINVNVGEFTS